MVNGGEPAAAAAAVTVQEQMVERLLRVVPRTRGFRVHADGSVSVFASQPLHQPGSSRAAQRSSRKQPPVHRGGDGGADDVRSGSGARPRRKPGQRERRARRALVRLQAVVRGFLARCRHRVALPGLRQAALRRSMLTALERREALRREPELVAALEGGRWADALPVCGQLPLPPPLTGGVRPRPASEGGSESASGSDRQPGGELGAGGGRGEQSLGAVRGGTRRRGKQFRTRLTDD